MTKTIFAITERCVACKSCEIACSVEHSVSKTLFGAAYEEPRSRSRMTVQQAAGYSYPLNCNHCENASCMNACPTGAMSRDPNTNSVYVVTDKCIGCWMCVMACPFGAVTADHVSKTALKCDRCPERVEDGLEPACVDACPTNALIYDTAEGFLAMKKQSTADQAIGINLTAQIPANVEIWRNIKRGI
ncbi:MAG: 4Fe-4S dicluster domain-containing protein [Gammaproteobacteria bacterium]|nr:4Fe-4S dicluster domain-containing protein [Gammaproteobacteria bacterium]